MSGIGGSAPFHQASAAERGDKPAGAQGLMDGMSDKLTGGIEKVAGWFDKSRMRQVAFAVIVMPAITLIAMSALLGPGFFHQGFAALQNPGVMQITGMPIVAVLAACTVYGILAIMGRDMSEKNKNIIKRIVRFAALPIYLAGLAWFSCFIFNMMGGLAHANYSSPVTSQGYPANFSLSAGGLLTTAWPFLLTIAGLPLASLVETFFLELDYFAHEVGRQNHLHAGKPPEEILRMHRREQDCRANTMAKQRLALQEVARVDLIQQIGMEGGGCRTSAHASL